MVDDINDAPLGDDEIEVERLVSVQVFAVASDPTMAMLRVTGDRDVKNYELPVRFLGDLAAVLAKDAETLRIMATIDPERPLS